ncbi:MAG: VanZ family protein [Coriobacteriales bacterium]|nr:VanZ family protein [Coriobacteriales bacterium]
MKQKIIKILVALIISICAWVMMRFVVYVSAFSSLVMLLGFKTMDDRLFVECVLLIFSILLYVNIYQLLSNRFSAKLIKIEAIVFFALLLAITMLKSIGTREINMDIFDIYSSIIEYPASVLINFLLFIPVGAVFFYFLKTFPKAFLASIALVVGIEASQYLFSLGICDIVDFTIDMIGATVGILIPSILRDYGYRIIYEDKYFLKIARLQKSEADCAVAPKDKMLDSKIKLICATVFLVVFILTTATGFAFYDYKGYVASETVNETNDDTLFNMYEKSTSVDEMREIINNLARFKVDDLESSNEWLSISSSGIFKARGVIANYEPWLAQNDTLCYGVSLAVQEELGNIVVAHGLPLIVTSETKFLISGNAIDHAEFEEIILQQFFLYNLEAEFSLQDGWFKAETLSFSPTKAAQNISYVWFNYQDFTESIKRAETFAGKHLFEISTGRNSTIDGYIDVLSESQGMPSYFTMRIDEQINNIVICHTLDVWFNGDIPSSFLEKLPKDNSSVSVKVSIQDGRAVYIE